ncbi:MAG: Rrf2 family transcriptional regulator [Firmicutes bacterium]|nr:Rrf2 family transcriptional regulator [Bacillota bacterium]
MQITRAGDYGIQGMLYLASLPEGKEAYIKEIAQARDIPVSFLAKIFQSLSRAGLVRSQRGAKGGFVLAKPAKEITLLDILQAIEGAIALNLCMEGENTCYKSVQCPVHPVLKEAQNELAKTLGRHNLEELVSKNGNSEHQKDSD